VLNASKLLKKGISERITGVDLMVDIVRECAKEGLTTGFFGGVSGVAEKTAECLQKSYPNLKVGFVGSEWGDEGFEKARKYQGASSTKNEESKTKLNTDYGLRSTNVIDILFVALGFPKQEEWIAANLDKIPVTAAMGVGGSFDYISGNVRRAPQFLRSIGLEWLFRLINEPWRVKRQLMLPKFVYLVLKEKLRSK
jgi:N-acetylglucosaminyldiphosphoundecaprenol N-acetyl-beta-D-mannosaminyltransferase